MKYSKILSILGIVCVAALLLVFGVRLQAENKTKEKNITVNTSELQAKTASRMEQFRNRQQGSNRGAQGRQQNWSREGRQQTSRWGGGERSRNSQSDNSSGFYRVIVDNNIFRPLGWRPPKKEPEYAYIGTKVDSTNGAKAEAYVHERRSNQFYIVTVGDKVGDAVVKEIKDKHIILDKSGEEIALREGNQYWISTGSRRGGGSSRADSNRGDDNNRRESTSKSSADKEKEAAMRKAREAAMQRDRQRREWAERAQEWRRRAENMSQEEREKMMYEYRSRRGRRGDR